MIPTNIFEVYWRFAAERQRILTKRLSGAASPFTEDHILSQYKFTNVYRVTDRTSQFLVRDVIYGNDKPLSEADQIFRILLFKIFNRIDTWKSICDLIGTPSIETSESDLVRAYQSLTAKNKPIYSAAYIMPPPPCGQSKKKFERHLQILFTCIKSGEFDALANHESLEKVYKQLLDFPSFGRFLAFQYAIDIAYSEESRASESDFVIAGPGAVRGIKKCFENIQGHTPESIIMHVYENQNRYLEQYGIDFDFILGRPLQPVDCQNIFCELDKYTRVSHPELSASSGRQRIKQKFNPQGHLDPLFLPPKWGILEGQSNA